MKITLSLLTIVLLYTNGISQTLIYPDSLVTSPLNSFYSSSQSFCFDGSGLSSAPTDVSSALTVTHNSPAVVSPISSADAAYLSNGIFETSWNFSFNTMKNIKGIALWLPCAMHNGGDAPFKKISIFNGTTTDTVNLGQPSDSVKVIYFSSTYTGTTNININVLETWYDLNESSPSCGSTGWGTYNPSSGLNSQYNIMLGEIMFIEDNTLSLNELTSDNLTAMAYPNPTNGNISITLKEFQTNIKATLSNSLGQIMFTQKFESADFISLDIDQPRGVYFLTLETPFGETKTIKVVKK